MVEMDVLKQENKNLRMKLRNSNQIQKQLIFEGRNNESLSPYSYQKRVQDHHRSFEREHDQDRSRPHMYENYNMDDQIDLPLKRQNNTSNDIHIHDQRR